MGRAGFLCSLTRGSLDVLQLLPQSLDLFLDGDGRARDRHVVRLRSDRVGFAMHLLHQKIQRVDDWVSIGSSNIDRWNLRWNYAHNLAVAVRRGEGAFLRTMTRSFVEYYARHGVRSWELGY